MEWISVKDRLPPEYTTVLTFDGEYIHTGEVGWVDNDGVLYWLDCSNPPFIATHWMPLPLPPEKD